MKSIPASRLMVRPFLHSLSLNYKNNERRRRQNQSKWNSNKKRENAEINFNEPAETKSQGIFLSFLPFAEMPFFRHPFLVMWLVHWYIFSRPETLCLAVALIGTWNCEFGQLETFSGLHKVKPNFSNQIKVQSWPSDIKLINQAMKLWFMLERTFSVAWKYHKFLNLMNFWRSSNIYTLSCDTFFPANVLVHLQSCLLRLAEKKAER